MRKTHILASGARPMRLTFTTKENKEFQIIPGFSKNKPITGKLQENSFLALLKCRWGWRFPAKAKKLQLCNSL